MMRWLVLFLLIALPSAARAQEVVEVADALRGVSMWQHVEWLEDPGKALSLDEVRRATGFHHDGRPALNFGFSDAAYWLRFRLGNRARAARALVLEVAHPQLDYVTLYVPTEGGGFEVRRTGDQLPFATRDLAYRNFLFTLEEPPGDEARTYYLRVQSSGVLELPLNLWTVEQFVEHQHLDWAVLCVYYGVLLVLALYALVLAILTREPPALQFCTLVFATGLFQLAVVGHAVQHLFPDSRYLAQVAVPVSMALLSVCNVWFGKHILSLVDGDRTAQRLLDGLLAVSLVIFGLAFALPVRDVLTVQVLVAPVMYGCGLWLVVRQIRRGVREGWVVLVSYGLVVAATVVSALKNAGLLPVNFFTVWAYQLAASLQLLMLAATASLRLRVLQQQLLGVNDELLHKVEQLEEAVVSAERATRLTEWATRVKDEFMATMSHELRTPLNTIINIPEGLAEEFVREPQAVCAHCAAVFVLDPGESTDVACPSCGRGDSLTRRVQVRFAGDGTRAVRYLDKIERSGSHLLGVVNGMLAADKGESGRVVLQRDWFDVNKLARDVLDDMSDLAERAGVKLVLEADEEPNELSADPLRLRQVLINLVSNAIKFSNGQGTVRVRVSREGGAACFAVVDQGIGIAPDKLDSVFGSYQQVHEARAYGGTGLGLSISRSLVRAHGGELTVESKLGEGSSFCFSLPRRRRDQKSA